MLYGASGATRKGTLKGGKWHGEATYTTQVLCTADIVMIM